MKLKRGITGFWHIREGFEASEVDAKLFKTRLYSIEYEGLYKVSDFKEPEYCNFFKIKILDRWINEEFHILLNMNYPYYCGVSFESEVFNLHFIELPIQITDCCSPDFTYLPPQELNSTIEQKDLNELSKVELNQIHYWKPKTFGEIIFNGYD